MNRRILIVGAELGKIQSQDIPFNIRKGKGWYLSRGIILALILVAMTIFCVQLSKAQPPFNPQNPPKFKAKMDGQAACWQSSDLGLTEEQTKALETLQHDYMAEAWLLRRELLPLRFELRHLIRDPNIPSKVLFDRQKRMSELQMKLDSLSFSYQMKVRSIFTKEQLERLPEDCLTGIGAGYDILMGTGRRFRSGTR
jgi:Spy/CpxP family protein refolding chaperone